MENGKNEPRDARSKKISDFTELETWKNVRALRKELYRLTQSFPKEERYGLSAQIKRAASSVTANLAEGYARFSFQENLQFCR
jgi:four helix bundle protein